MSLGSASYVDSYDPSYQIIINDAFDNGIAIFAATGNDAEGYDSDGDGTPYPDDADDDPYNGCIKYPAAYDNVMAVGSTDYNDQRSYYSQYGSGFSSTDPAPIGSIDIVAPGGDVTADEDSDGNGDGILQETTNDVGSSFNYYYYQGTSMATPHAAGLAALLKSVDGTLTPQEIYDAMTSTAGTSMTGYNSNEYGAGIIDPLVAVQYVNGGGTSYNITDSVTGELTTTGEANGDVWEISVAEGTININLAFSHADDGDFDLKLYHQSNWSSPVDSSVSSTDNESISYDTDAGAGAGTYKIVVYAYSIAKKSGDVFFTE